MISMSGQTTIEMKGLKRHLRDVGVDYDKFCELMHDGASISFMSRKFGYSRNSVRKWATVFHKENG